MSQDFLLVMLVGLEKNMKIKAPLEGVSYISPAECMVKGLNIVTAV